jgi:hypothetical protein
MPSISSEHSDWRSRLKERLEPVLQSPTVVADISIYQGVPFAIFCYYPTEELAVRREVRLLAKRIETASGRKVHVFSMADLLKEAIERVYPPAGQDFYDGERSFMDMDQEDRLQKVQGDVERLLSEEVPLPESLRVLSQGMTKDKDIIFLTRVGALFPAYRASALLENLMGIVTVPTVLFYPGTRSGPSSLRFMDSLDAIHGYRCKIF